MLIVQTKSKYMGYIILDYIKLKFHLNLKLNVLFSVDIFLDIKEHILVPGFFKLKTLYNTIKCPNLYTMESVV